MGAIGGRKLNVKITGGTPASVLFAGYLTNARWNSADSETDTLTFADAAAGGAKDHFFQGTAVQDDGGDSAAFQTFSENNAGAEVFVTIMPQGNTTASTAQPHRGATCVVAAFDGDWFGGEANNSANFKQSYDFSWGATGRPQKITS